MFIYNPKSKQANDTNKGWVHVGFYVGRTDMYEYTVVEADSVTGTVKYTNLLDSNFNCYGILKGVVSN